MSPVPSSAHSTCAECGKRTQPRDILHLTHSDRSKAVCSRCFNIAMAAAAGNTTFQHLDLQPLAVADSRAVPHTFHFRLILLGDSLSIDAFELTDEPGTGYEFQTIGHATDDPLSLLVPLVQRIRRALAETHLTEDEFGLFIADAGVVKGRIEMDTLADEPETPLIIIDGRPVSWTDFGRMLMAFEGFQFKLQLQDKSKEI